MYQRDLFDTQLEITDQLIEQGSPLFAEADAQRMFGNWMKLYPNATEKQRWERFQEITDPAKNKRGTVYSSQYEAEALRILNLK